MGMQPMGPGATGQNRGGPEQERLMQEAEHQRQIEETEEIHAEEAAETGSASPATPAPASKSPWWKFWSS